MVWLLLFLLPSLLKSVSLQDKWCLVKEMLLWIVLGCHCCLSSQVGRGEFSFAHVSLDSPLALFTGYVAAPVIFAVATLHHFVHVGVVASATAHQVAAVTPIGGLVALSGRRKMLWASANSCRDSQTTAVWCCWDWQLCQALGEANSPLCLQGWQGKPWAVITQPAMTPKITLNSCSDSQFGPGSIQAFCQLSQAAPCHEQRNKAIGIPLQQELIIPNHLCSQTGSKTVWKELEEDDTLKNKQWYLSTTA